MFTHRKLSRYVFVGIALVTGLVAYYPEKTASFYTNCKAVLGLSTPSIKEIQVATPYGYFAAHPVIQELIDSPAMQRIKHVRQYGVVHYIVPQKFEYTRFDHSVGVWALLKAKGACLEEQIAGLLHDASHTVFSHVGDQLFKNNSDKSSYQDNIHEWFLRKMGVEQVLSKYGITLEQVLHKSGDHKALEQDLPDVCADRLEYNLQAGLLTDMLTKEEVMTLFNDAQFDGEHWFFTNVALAKKLGDVSLFNSKYVWGGIDTHVLDVWAAQALQRALDIKLLTLDDVHFSTDDVVWEKLKKSEDSELATTMNKLIGHKDSKLFKNVALAQADYSITIKCRGINPLIKVEDGSLKRLIDCDVVYKASYDAVKTELKNGLGLAFVDKADQAYFRTIAHGRTT